MMEGRAKVRAAVLVATLTGALVSVGCSGYLPQEGAENGPQITLQEAREFQNSTLLELAAFVPLEWRVDPAARPIEKMSAMSCSWHEGSRSSWKKDGAFLPGGFDFDVHPGHDLTAALEEARRTFQERQGWHAAWSDEGGSRKLVVTSADGYDFYLRVSNGGETLRMSSFSPCLRAPDDFDIFEKY